MVPGASASLSAKSGRQAHRECQAALHIWFWRRGPVISGKKELNGGSYLYVMGRKSPAHPHIHSRVKEIKEGSIASMCVCMCLVCGVCRTSSVSVCGVIYVCVW